jgi:hypothetical protein
MVEQELNVFTVLQLLRKLKVSMTVLINNDKEKIKKIEDLYYDCSTITIDKDKQKHIEESKPRILSWFESD